MYIQKPSLGQAIDVIRQDQKYSYIDQFIEKVKRETDWMVAPCSTKYHACYEGGLFEHSLL